MRLPEIAIKNYQFTIVIVALLVLLGIVSIFTMPYSEDPAVSPAGSTVIVIYSGANPKDMEQLVADPIEEAIDELDDINELISTSSDSVALVAVEFVSGSDPDEKYSDVIEKVNSIRNNLPDGITSLETVKWSVSDTNILQIAIVSDSASYSDLEDQAEKLRKRLIKSYGVKKSEKWAFPEREVRVSLNLDKMSRMQISLNQVFYAIQSANMNIPGGRVNIGDQSFNIQTSGIYKSLDDISNTIVSSDGRSIIYLKDIGNVDFGYKDEEYRARFNGTRAVFVTATQKEGTNIFNVFGGIRKSVSEFEKHLPKSMKLHYVLDQSKSVSNRVRTFASNLLQGMVLVGIVIFLSLSFRSSIIVMMVIPFSILIGIGFVDLSGYGIQQMTIAGMVIALGMLVDNAIVVTENTNRFLKLGFNKKDAAAKATEQIAWAIISATVTTILAFVPIILMRDITGDFIRSMPVTVVYTLLASLFIALTFTPFLASRFLKAENGNKDNSSLNPVKRINMGIQRLYELVIQNYYGRILDFALSHTKTVITCAILFFVGSLSLFPLIGVSFFPKAEKPHIIININTPQDASLDKTDEVARFVESVVCSMEELKHCAVNVGHGNPRIYYNIASKERDQTHAQVFIELEKYDPKTMPILLKQLREKFANYPDASIEVKELEQGPPVEAPVAIRIMGEDLDVLEDVSMDVEKIILSTPGTINLDNPLKTSKLDLRVKIDREKAGLMGVQLVDIDRTIRTAMAGMTASKFRDNKGDEYDIVIRLPVSNKTAISDLDKIYLTSVIGTQVPLKQLASVEFEPSLQRISHFDMDRTVTVTADVLRDYSVADVTNQIISKLKKYNWPEGYRYNVGGEAESREESFGGMGKAIVIAMLGIFAILILQFKSLSQPFIIFIAIPLGIAGSMIALLITGYTFSFTAFIGLTSLVGIVVNNSIILVEYTNQLRQEGKELISAIKEAGQTRFRPIYLTTATTIGGLLPLTLRGGNMWAPMGWTIIGGLSVSTVLTLVVVPVLYKIFSSRTEKKNS